ncbi:MAG: hypothetical protein ACJAT2_003755 [Bacteriovoracaceae bacterium]|jgi:hypothetical protein
MKVAVLGGGALAMEMARALNDLEAAVTLFSDSDELKGIVPIKSAKVLRVTKRFLGPEDELENRSRLADLFRVTYQIDPKKLIESQQIDNPELYKQFDEQMMKSLGKELESFEDFDLVVDASENKIPLMLGPGGSPALNELSLKDEGPLFYGKDCFEFLKSQPSKPHLVLSGEGDEMAQALLSLKEWTKQSGNDLTLVTDKKLPFEGLSSELSKEIDSFIQDEETNFTQKMEAYRDEVFKWRELEDYMKAKVPMPTEPKPPFEILLNSYITSIDKLIDNDGWYLTVESPDFKSGDAKVELRTLKADNILVLKGYKRDLSLCEHLQTEYNKKKNNSLNPNGFHSEPGFYTLCAENLEDGKSKIKEIISNMLSFFSRV